MYYAIINKNKTNCKTNMTYNKLILTVGALAATTTAVRITAGPLNALKDDPFEIEDDWDPEAKR